MPSVFTNVSVYPSHGDRVSAITWETEVGTEQGDVYVAFSSTGTDGSWEVVNADNPIPSETGTFMSADLVMNSGAEDGYYQLLLTTDSGDDHFSKPIRIRGYLSQRELGIVRAAMHQEYTQMRVTNGFPVWHCIPRSHGELAESVDPDTGKQSGSECDVAIEDNSFGLKYKGGFYPPVLTWISIKAHREGLQDDPEDFSPSEIHKSSVRMMAFPRPARGHMIVDPVTDKRYLVSDEIKPFRLRGIIAIAHNVTLEFLSQKDERYKFPVPEVDVAAYRRQPYWVPSAELPYWNPTP